MMSTYCYEKLIIIWLWFYFKILLIVYLWKEVKSAHFIGPLRSSDRNCDPIHAFLSDPLRSSDRGCDPIHAFLSEPLRSSDQRWRSDTRVPIGSVTKNIFPVVWSRVRSVRRIFAVSDSNGSERNQIVIRSISAKNVNLLYSSTVVNQILQLTI